MKLCNHYEPIICDDLKAPPYVCNSCKVQDTCRAAKYFYKAEEAQKRYKAILSESRAGINMTPEQLKELDDFISPLIRNDQPLSHIFSVYGDSLPCSRNTIYNYLDMGIFTEKNIDLPRRVRYKLRKKRRGENPIKYAYRNRKTYKDFLKYTEMFPEYEVVEMTANRKRRTRVFYCDPCQSNQKGRLEKSHEFIRCIIPKGRSMHKLTDEKVRLMACHINSVA